MSIAIQKKRLNKKNQVEYAQAISQFKTTNPLHDQYFKFLQEFEVNFKKSASQITLKSLKVVLESFYKQVKVDEFFLTDLSKHGDSSQNNSDNIFLITKTSDIVNMVADYILNKKSILIRNRRSFDLLDKISSETKDVTLLCVKILKLFAIINIHFAILLSNKKGFCARMFELMLQDNKAYFKQVLGIQEALIAANNDIVNPSIYPYMQEVLFNMPKKYFARFSRIIALFVLENTEKTDFKELPSGFNENKMISIHSFILGIPDLIETYAVILEYLREIMERLISTNPQNLRKSLRYLKESNLIKDSGLNLSFLKPLFEQSQFSESLVSEIFMPKFIVKFMVKKSNLTEILFIISNLLSSKRKVEVQNRLRQINFMEKVMSPLFDLLFHPDLDSQNTEDPFYNDDCSSNNPLATTRIQLLRIVINFCDRDTPNILNKDVLLSSEEKSILYSQLIPGALRVHNKTYTPPETTPRDIKTISKQISSMELQDQDRQDQEFFTSEVLKNDAFANVEKKGLLHKIINLFNYFHPNSNYRFWLASCVEAFLRGFHEAHQAFVAHTGILYHLLDQIINKKISRASNLQISYDLIGEIVKFNKYNVIFLEKMCENFDWTQSLVDKALVNVVYSNVFLRAMFLSFERFEHSSASKESFNERSQLHSRFAQERMKCFHLIIESVESTLINQDNICCINTTLIMAIFADQKGLLEAYFKGLINKDDICSEKAKKVMENFNHVLEIWHRYYMSKTRDSFSLEYTSSIPFHYFSNMKHKLQSLCQKQVETLTVEA